MPMLHIIHKPTPLEVGEKKIIWFADARTRAQNSLCPFLETTVLLFIDIQP